MVDPLFLDRLELLLVGLEQGLDRRHRLRELLARLFEEGLARVAEQLVRDLVELRREALLGVLERFDLLLERFLALFLRSPQRGELIAGSAVRVALLDHLVELQPQVFDGLLRAGGLAARPQPAERTADDERHKTQYNGGRVHDRDSPGTLWEL